MNGTNEKCADVIMRVNGKWHDRQEKEKQRHDKTMNEIAAGLIGILIGTQIK